MKYLRPLIPIFFLTALASPVGFSQFVKVWQDTAGTTGPFWWLQKADNNATSLAYNPSTGHLLVSRRNDRIYALDATSGNLLDSLSNTGTSGSFRFNMIRSTSDGVIYALSLATAATSSFTIYRWANEATTPTQAVVTYVSVRTGDSFGLSGSGTNTVLYCGGSGSTKIYVFTTSDGVSFSKTDSITVTSGEARGGISPVTTGTASDLWINGAGTPTRKISSTGTTLVTPVSTTSAGLPTDSIHTAWHRVQYFQQGANKFLALVGRNDATSGKIMPVYNITTSETNPTLYGYTQLSNIYNTNLNATSDIAVKDNGDGTVTVFQLVTNNGVAAWASVAVPTTPQLVTPANNSTDRPLNVVLRWSVSTGAATYRMQVATDLGFTSPVIDDSTVTDTLKQMSGLSINTKYYWRVNAKNVAGTSGYSEIWNFTTGTQTGVADVETVPNEFSLSQNFPNPFNPTTTIRYHVGAAGMVTLKILDLLGREVSTLVHSLRDPGTYTVTWDGKDDAGSKMSSGVYFSTLTAASFTQTKKMILMQ